MANFRPNWKADYDEVVGGYIERLGAPTTTLTQQIPFGPYKGRYFRSVTWERSGFTFNLMCQGLEPIGMCQAFGALMMGAGYAEKVEAVLIAYGE